ncbi:unnamed protein product [Rotaria magnacalcarata]|uniref:Uncharacterized protein n=1 Tax=Rotaria magnacalcarata TaxID=392030 RepID=A0A8S2PYR1_9BILA|nr:unnamed protein product [Rotaria magnacalcarata]
MICDLHKSCGISYTTYAAYKSHVHRCHSSLLHSTNEENFYSLTANNTQQLNMDPNADVNIMNDNVTINTINEDDEDDFSSDSIEADTCNDDQQQQATNTDSQNLFKSSCNEESNISFISDIQKSFALFILQLREEFYLPKSTINSISNYIVILINHLELLFEQKTIRNDLGNAKNISSSKSTSDSNNDIIELKIVKSTMKEVCRAVEAITYNEYEFINYCKKYFKHSPPEEVTISAPSEDVKCGYFVPIDQTLTSILRNQDTVDQIFDSLTNPIGVKKDRHKMFMVYFSLEDFPDQYRSQLEQIYLVAVCESGILMDNAKAKSFFQPIIENLNRLQVEGLFVNGQWIKFSFSTMVADNLAAHQIGGFQASFSNDHFCRRCLIGYPKRNLPRSTTKLAARTSIIHDDFVQQISANPNQSPLMGVAGQSPLHDLIGFHSTMSLLADLMHDYLQGICPLVIMSLLKEASSMHSLTYARIQEQMENFQYGYFDSRDRPPPIQIKHLQKDRISATVSQKLCLFRLFPIIFNDVIYTLPSIIVYKQLREMIDLVLSVPFRKLWLPTLRDLWAAFHQSMLNHFPSKMTPRLHFCSEYDKVINDYGPTIKQWCTRYEAFHSYFKKISLRSNNYKNIPKMLATRYRLKQTFISCRTVQLKTIDQTTVIQKVKNNFFDNLMKQTLIHHFGNISFSKDLQQCKKFYNQNVEYHRGSVYIMDFVNVHETPRFFQVVLILKMNYKWWLFVDLLETTCYNERFCAWEIKSMNNYSILDPHRLRYFYKGLDIYELENSSFVLFNARLTLY